MTFKKSKIQIILGCLLSGILLFNQVYGQQSIVDSLKLVVSANPSQDTLKVNQLNDLAAHNFSYNAQDLNTYSQQALLLAKKLNYKSGEANAYKNLAMSYMIMHGDATALKYLNNSLTIFSASRDTVNVALVTNYIGCFYATLKDFKQALPYFLKSEKLYAQRTDKVGLTIFSNTGSCYEDLKQYDKAKYYYRKVELLANEIKDYDWIVMSLYQTASLHLISKNYRKALNTCNEALSIIRQHEVAPRSEQTIYLLLGDIRYKLKQYEQSRLYYTTSAELAKKMKSRENMAEIYYKFHLLDSIAGNYQSSLSNFKQYKIITDSLINQNKNQIIALYKVKYSLKEEEAKNDLLTAETKNHQKTIFYDRLILLIAFVSLAIIGFSFLRLKKLITALKDRNGKIALQNTQLEELNGIKTKIFSVIAHDLRNPFAQLINILELANSKIIDTDEFLGLMPFLNKSVRQGLEMMDNLLTWSKSQLNGFKVVPVEINLNELVQDTLDKLQIQIDEKKLIVSRNKFNSVTAWADQEMIRIVVRNLLSNAIKFTPENGIIEIESNTENQRTILAIRDFGIGMPKEQLDNLFTFNLKSTPGTANEAGTGLGLKICMDLLELNKGKIWVESTQGKGSAFYVSLPMKV